MVEDEEDVFMPRRTRRRGRLTGEERNPVLPEEVADIRHRFAAGERLADIARATGRHYNTVRRVLAKCGDRPTRHWTDPEEDATLLHLYKRGATWEELRRHRGASCSVIVRLLRDHCDINRTQAEKIVQDAAVEHYVDRQLSPEQTAAALGIDRTTVVNLVHQAGVKMRPLPPMEPEDIRRLAVRRYQEGLSFAAVANEVGKSTEGVMKWVRQAGVPTRPRQKLIKLDFS